MRMTNKWELAQVIYMDVYMRTFLGSNIAQVECHYISLFPLALSASTIPNKSFRYIMLFESPIVSIPNASESQLVRVHCR
jgi:hypothetical protein